MAAPTEGVDFADAVEEIDRTPVKVLVRNKSDLSYQFVMEVDFATAVEWAATLHFHYGENSTLRSLDTRGFHALTVDPSTASVQMKPKGDLVNIFQKRCRDLTSEWGIAFPIERQR